jgi:hypothetical protein
MLKKQFSVLLRILVAFVFLCCIEQITQAAENELPWFEVPEEFKYEWLIEPKYTWAGTFSEGLWPVEHENGLRGYVDSADNVVLELQGIRVSSFRNGIAFVHTSSDISADAEGKTTERKIYGVIDKNGRYLIEPRLELDLLSISHLTNTSLVQFRTEDDKFGFLNLSGDVQIPALYDQIAFGEFSEDKVAVKSGELWGIINAVGEWLVPPRYTELQYYWKGHIPFLAKGESLWGFLDERGEIALEPKYTNIITNLHLEGPWIVELEGKKGVLGEKLEVVVEPRYESSIDDICFYRGGIAFIDDGDVYKALDTQGNELFAFSVWLGGGGLPQPIQTSDGYYALGQIGELFLVDKTGKMLLPPEFEILMPNAEGIVSAKKGGRHGLWGLIKLEQPDSK